MRSAPSPRYSSCAWSRKCSIMSAISTFSKTGRRTPLVTRPIPEPQSRANCVPALPGPCAWRKRRMKLCFRVYLEDEVNKTPQSKMVCNKTGATIKRRAGFMFHTKQNVSSLQHVITISISHRGVYSLFSVFPDVWPLYLKAPTAQTSRPQFLGATKL